MNLISVPVVGAAGVCASPALYQAVVTGRVPLETALARYLVALVLCWLAISLVAALVGEPPRPVGADGATERGGGLGGEPDRTLEMERPTGVAPES